MLDTDDNTSDEDTYRGVAGSGESGGRERNPLVQEVMKVSVSIIICSEGLWRALWRQSTYACVPMGKGVV